MHKTRFSLGPLTALVLVVCSAPAACEADEVYDWKFVAGRTITFSTTSDQTVKTTLGGKSTVDVHHHVVVTYARRTLSISNDKAEMELGPTKMRVEVKYGKANAKWDSENRRLRKARSLPFIKPFASEYDRKTLFTMDIPGRAVSNVRFEPANGAKALAPGFSADFAREDLETSRRLFPTTPVGVGDSWDWVTRAPVDSFHLLVLEGKREVVGFEEVNGKRCVKLKGVRKGKIVPAQPGQTISIKLLESSETSHSWFDIERGFLVKEENESTTKTRKVLNVVGQGEQAEVEARTSKTSFLLESVTIEGR